MIKRILILLVSGIFIFGSSKFLFAQKEVAPDTKESQDINVGNKICPVSGEKIDERLKVTYEDKGKIYNFCCPMCVEEFKKDPEKYIKKVEEELKAKAEEEVKEEAEQTKPESPVHEGGHEGHHHH